MSLGGEDGRDTDLTGREAYQLYGPAVHRTAGLAGQLNIETVASAGFERSS